MKKRKRTKDNLIPVEQIPRVISLSYRGRERKGRKVAACVSVVLSFLCAVYFCSIYFFMGYGSNFFIIWAVFAVLFGSISFILFSPNLLRRIPGWMKRIVMTGMILIGVLFLIVEGLILSQAWKTAEDGADYIIILGAQWKSSGPSYLLQKRLDKAVEYLNDNPDTIVIVSGGQGANEPISEAAGMSEYLENAGIVAERIIQEDTSTNTAENLKFSSAFLDKETDRVVIVTNNYHVFRSVKLAQKQGYANVNGLAASSHYGILPNNLLREFLAVIKDFLVGNI